MQAFVVERQWRYLTHAEDTIRYIFVFNSRILVHCSCIIYVYVFCFLISTFMPVFFITYLLFLHIFYYIFLFLLRVFSCQFLFLSFILYTFPQLFFYFLFFNFLIFVFSNNFFTNFPPPIFFKYWRYQNDLQGKNIRNDVNLMMVPKKSSKMVPQKTIVHKYTFILTLY